MKHVYDLMTDRAIRRRENFHTEETQFLPPPEWMNETVIVSRYSRVGMETKRRYLLDNVLIRVTEDFREPPSAVARDYLMCKYKHSPMWTTSQRERIMAELTSHPLYCKPSTFEHGFYIDIAAAWWSVMVRCGWDVDYYPGRWLSVALPPLDFPYSDHKVARNCLVSVARSTEFNLWSPSKGNFTMSRGNPRANTQIYVLIQDTLNGIASEIIAAGAVYVFTDGYIAPNPNIAAKIVEIIQSWGFYARVHGEGEGFVNALGSYSVGRYRTRSVINEPAPYHSIKKLDYHKWLRNKMAWARSQAPWHDNFVSRPIEPLRYLG